jgi:protein SCO1/2
MMKPVLATATIVVAGSLAVAGWFALQPSSSSHVSPAMVNADGAAIGGPFELTTHTGARITADELIDGPTLIYFGYTFCPDICPVDTQIMADAVDLLAERGIAVKPVFITIDPERDTPKELSYYAEAMHPKLVALTGTEAEVRVAADAYKVFYQRVDLEDSAAGYLMNHTGYTYLMTPQKGITALFRRDFPPEQIADDIEKVLGELVS